jgi:hypothetical protein
MATGTDETAKTTDYQGDSMTTEAANWTIAYRKPRANKFHRVTNWAGTWREASDMAAVIRDLPEFEGLEIWYVPTRAAEMTGYSHAEDMGNIMTNTGRRVGMTETGSLPGELANR